MRDQNLNCVKNILLSQDPGFVFQLIACTGDRKIKKDFHSRKKKGTLGKWLMNPEVYCVLFWGGCLVSVLAMNIGT